MEPTYPTFVHLLPKLIPEGSLAGGVAVVIDVLRATTVMAHALDSGASQILPRLEIDEAIATAARFKKEEVLLVGERKGLPIDGFDLGNSPASFTPQACQGRTVVMTTTNGTRALHASLSADRVLIASFVNLRATVESLWNEPTTRPIHLVCAGTDGLISLEDSLLAGAIASALATGSGTLANDEARMMARLWDALQIEGENAQDHLFQALSQGRGGRRVREIGLEADLNDASQLNRFPFVIEVQANPTRIVRRPS